MTPRRAGRGRIAPSRTACRVTVRSLASTRIAWLAASISAAGLATFDLSSLPSPSLMETGAAQAAIAISNFEPTAGP